MNTTRDEVYLTTRFPFPLRFSRTFTTEELLNLHFSLNFLRLSSGVSMLSANTTPSQLGSYYVQWSLPLLPPPPPPFHCSTVPVLLFYESDSFLIVF